MTCTKCGKELTDGTNICTACGAENGTKTDGKKKRVKFKDLSKKQKITRIIIGCVCLLVAAFFIFGDALTGAQNAGDSEDVYVMAVKSGALYDYPDETIGDAFNDFFSDPEWKSFVSDDGRTIVEFNGGCTFDGEDAQCCIQFEVFEDGTFETDYADIDGMSLNSFDIDVMYETIYEN